MGKLRKKSIIAGPLVYEALYPIQNPRDSDQVRRGKQAATKAAQQAMNTKAMWLKLELLLAANFRKGDLVVTLTFREDSLPENRSGVQRCLKGFFKSLRERRGLRAPLFYVYRIEHWHSRKLDGLSDFEIAKQGRWHIHLVCNGTGRDMEDIAASWPHGLWECKPLRVDREKNYESQARYMTKEERDKVGHRAFTASIGLKKPEVDTVIVHSSEKLSPPRGADVYANSGEVETIYGKHQFVKYCWPKLIEEAPKARRKRRKRSA